MPGTEKYHTFHPLMSPDEIGAIGVSLNVQRNSEHASISFQTSCNGFVTMCRLLIRTELSRDERKEIDDV